MQLKYKEKVIWFLEENILRSKSLVLTDMDKAQALLESIKNLDNWIRTNEFHYDTQLEQNEITYGKYSARARDGKFPKSTTEITFLTRTPTIWQLLTDQCDQDSDVDLLTLCNTDTTLRGAHFLAFEYLQEFAKAENTVDELLERNVSADTVETIIRKMWPDFGLFAFDFLDFVEVKTKEKYNIDDLTRMIHLVDELGFNPDSTAAMSLLKKKALAKSNQKVLKLAEKLRYKCKI